MMLNKEEAFNNLSSFFAKCYIRTWLNEFPDDILFDEKTLFSRYIHYINSINSKDNTSEDNIPMLLRNQGG